MNQTSTPTPATPNSPESAPAPLPDNSNKSRWLLLILVLILALGLWVGLRWYGQFVDPVPPVETAENGGDELPPDTVTPPADETGWQTYRNEEYGFEFQYPGDQIKSIGIADPDKFYQDATQPSFSIITTSGIYHSFSLKDFDIENFSSLAGEGVDLGNLDLMAKKVCATSYCDGSLSDGFDYYLFEVSSGRSAHFLFSGIGFLG